MSDSAPSADRRRVAVIGAGIVGICCALHLRRDGHEVALFDPDPPGAGCSFGNAGGIVPSAVVPLSSPGTLAAVPRMLADPLAPLTIRWAYLPRMLPWLWHYLRAGTPARVEGISRALAELLKDSVEAYVPLVEGAGAAGMIQRRGLLYAYESEAAYRDMQAGHDMRRRRGVRIEELDAQEVRQLEPTLSPNVTRGVFIPDCAHIVNPLRLSGVLAADFARKGGTIHRTRVTGFDDFGPDGPRRVMTSDGTHATDAVVIAAGAHSRPLAAMLGARVPLDAERGYHAMLPAPGIEVRVPLVSGDGKFAITPMEHGLRLAGTVELAGLDAEPNYERARILVEQARRLLPGLRTEGATFWMGRRPTLPDSLPVIGPSPRHRAAFFAFGHQHIGLTLGAVTGRLIADLVAGRPTPIDMTPYRADRF